MLLAAINKTGPYKKTGEWSNTSRPATTSAVKKTEKNRHTKSVSTLEDKENISADAMTEGVRIVCELTSKRGNQLTDGFISELMAELNTVWQSRASKSVGFVRGNC